MLLRGVYSESAIGIVRMVQGERDAMNDPKTVSCVCDGPGLCKRHKDAKGNPVIKTQRLFELCQAGGAYWKAWENGRGPRQGDLPTPVLPVPADVPSRARARRLACENCPAGHWDSGNGVCKMRTSRPCYMNGMFNRPHRVCIYWSA